MVFFSANNIVTMAFAPPSTHTALLFFYFTILLFTFSITTITTVVYAHDTITSKSQRFVVKLIHRDSVHFPYFNSSETISDRAKHAVDSSMARYAYLNSKARSSSFATNVYRADLFPKDDIGSGIFLANISIGQPSVVQFAVMDIGSNLLWIQCLPCIKCFKQKATIFNPSKSSSYVNLSCYSPRCKDAPSPMCDQFNHCKYDDRILSTGNIATEMLSLKTSNGSTTTVTDVVVGFAHKSKIKSGLTSGILGLGPGKISLASQLGTKFSYCVGNLNDPYYDYNQLILGEGANLNGDPTPMYVFENQYYVTLEGISIFAGTRLNIEPGTFKRRPWGGGAIIDSGTYYTYLARGGFEPLFAKVKFLAQGILEPVIDYGNLERLCYMGQLKQSLLGFPVVTFHFAGGADLVLDIDSLFMQDRPNRFCMAILPTTHHKDGSVIGILAQQNYNIGYDLNAKIVACQRIACDIV